MNADASSSFRGDPALQSGEDVIKVLHGFVLPEILLVMFLIGFIATIGISVYRGQIQKAYDARRKSDLHRLKLAAEEYEKDYDCYPDTLPSCTSSTNELEDYIGEIPCDPELGYDYLYETDGLSCPRWFRIYARLKNQNDASSSDLGCNFGCGPGYWYTYYVSSPNAPEPLKGDASTTPTPQITLPPTPTPTITPTPSVTPTPTPGPTATPTPTPSPTPSGLPWYAAGWGYRKLITVSSSRVAGGASLTSFPILINRTDANWKTTANGGRMGQSDGGDIVFTLVDGITKLDHEIESYTATTGALVAWVEIPTLSVSSDTQIYIYYGNAAAANQQNVSGTWDTNYQAVWHLKETTGGADAIKDSTINVRHGTDVGSPTLGVAGQLDGATDFGNPNTTRRVDTKNFMSSGVTQWTAQAWVYHAATKDNRVVYKNNVGNSGAPVFGLAVGGNDLLRCRMRNSVGTIIDFSAGTISLNTWTFVACTWDGANVRAYKNGVSQGTPPGITGTLAATADVVVIAQNEAGTALDRHWVGKIDEARVSNFPRSAGWLLTEYNNQSSPSTFYSVGSEEIALAPGEVFLSGAFQRILSAIRQTTQQVLGVMTDALTPF